MSSALSKAEPTTIRPENVTCVTVTYGDRRALLHQVLDELLRQWVGKVVVVDNGSYWAVKHELEAAYGTFVDVVTMGRNTGSAGGYAAGIRHALKLGAEYLWLLDDDNLPKQGCLATLLAAYGRLRADNPADKLAVLAFRPEHQADVAAGVPLHRINPRRNAFYRFHLLDLPYKVLRRTSWIRHYRQRDLPAIVNLDVAPYSGLLLHRMAIEQMGLPREDFVLYADDLEYSHRLVRAGGLIALVTAAPLEDLESSWNVRSASRSTFNVLLTQGSDFQAYYGMRNSAYFNAHCRSHGRLTFLLNRLIFLNALAVCACLWGRKERYRLIMEAVRDGFSGKLGINPKFALEPRQKSGSTAENL